MAQAMRKIDITHESHYVFTRGFPTKGTLEQAYDDADLNRAIQAHMPRPSTEAGSRATSNA